jgi:hypothetical protein
MTDKELNYIRIDFEFTHSVYDFHENNPDFELRNYSILLKDRDIDSVWDADIETLDIQGTMAMLMFFVRGARFTGDMYYIPDLFKDGRIPKILKHLKELTETKNLK